MILVSEHPGAESVVDNLELEAIVVSQHFRDQVHHRLIVVDDQDPPPAALEGVGGDAILLHEPVECLPRNAPEPRSWHPKSAELTRVKTADNGLLTNLTNFGGFARREHGLHGRVRPILRAHGLGRSSPGGLERTMHSAGRPNNLPASPAPYGNHPPRLVSVRPPQPLG